MNNILKNTNLLDKDLSVGTQINLPIRIDINGEREEIGRFFANIERNLDGISIQIFINSDAKDIAKQHMDEIKQKYIAFYNKVVVESNLVGWDFIS